MNQLRRNMDMKTYTTTEDYFVVKSPKYIGYWDLTPIMPNYRMYRETQPSLWAVFWVWFFFRVYWRDDV